MALKMTSLTSSSSSANVTTKLPLSLRSIWLSRLAAVLPAHLQQAEHLVDALLLFLHRRLRRLTQEEEVEDNNAFVVDGPMGVGRRYFCECIASAAPWNAASDESAASTRLPPFYSIKLSKLTSPERPLAAEKSQLFYTSNQTSSPAVNVVLEGEGEAEVCLEELMWQITRNARGRHKRFTQWQLQPPEQQLEDRVDDKTKLSTTNNLTTSAQPANLKSTPISTTSPSVTYPSHRLSPAELDAVGGLIFVLLDDMHLLGTSSSTSSTPSSPVFATYIISSFLQFWRNTNLPVILLCPLQPSSPPSQLFLPRITLQRELDWSVRRAVLVAAATGGRGEQGAETEEAAIVRWRSGQELKEQMALVADWTGGYGPVELKALADSAVIKAIARQASSDDSQTLSGDEPTFVELADLAGALQHIEPPAVRTLGGICSFIKYKPTETDTRIFGASSPGSFARSCGGFDCIAGETELLEQLRLEVVEPFRRATRQPEHITEVPVGLILQGCTGTGLLGPTSLSTCNCGSTTSACCACWWCMNISLSWGVCTFAWYWYVDDIWQRSMCVEGKSFIACQLAQECQANLCVLRCGDIMRSTVGESEKALQSVFDLCRRSSPCLLLLEELQSIAPLADAAQPSASSRVLSGLLRNIDRLRLTSSPPLLLVATTPSVDLLDSRILKPYRIPLIYSTTTPSAWSSQDYIQLLQLVLSPAQPPSYGDLLDVADQMQRVQCGPAAAASTCREAGVEAIRRSLKREGKKIGHEKEEVHLADVIDALKGMV
eukprot:GHVS01084227.1.p1 GENE.GHVS01084227.1~~GHVS01084227.1.p1  ORF type:complete len:774 (+),score=145.97 GHVS01084227.1:187-2508(+)